MPSWPWQDLQGMEVPVMRAGTRAEEEVWADCKDLGPTFEDDVDGIHGRAGTLRSRHTHTSAPVLNAEEGQGGW